MSDKSVQVNIRASEQTAAGLRAEARERRVPLGDLLADLLQLSRSDREPGLWLSLSDEVLVALRSVAAARGESPQEILESLVRGTIHRELLQLAASLQSGGGGLVELPPPRLAQSPPVSAPGSAAPSSSAAGVALHSRKTDTPTQPVASGPSSSAEPATPDEPKEPTGDDEMESVGIITVFD